MLNADFNTIYQEWLNVALPVRLASEEKSQGSLSVGTRVGVAVSTVAVVGSAVEQLVSHSVFCPSFREAPDWMQGRL